MRRNCKTPGAPLAALLLCAIGFYQRRISPRKGWRCAYSVLHGGGGCSGFVSTAINERGVWAALPPSRERFQDCKRAAAMLRAQQHSLQTPGAPDQAQRKGRKARKSPSKWRFEYCGGYDLPCGPCFNALVDCGPGDVGVCDCTPCDCNPGC